MLPLGHALIAKLPPDAQVLDVGGWAAPLNRADWVIDLMPYETRGAIAAGVGPGPPRHDRDRWVVADLCDPGSWPFADGQFDFVLCTFTLEDLRDPVWVCHEMSRVGAAGYIEVPSLLDELIWGNPEASGGRWVGHEHHRWLCSLEADELVFLSKFHSLHSRPEVQVPPGLAAELHPEERVLAHHWTGRLRARERPAIDQYPFEELERAVRDRFAHRARELRRWRTWQRWRRGLR